MYTDLQLKYPFFFSDFNDTFDRFSKKPTNIKFKKSVLWELSYCIRTDRKTDGRTSMTKLAVRFRNSANSRKNRYFHPMRSDY
jgi:hypothetical protein